MVISSMQSNKFEKVGKLMALSLAQGGGGFPFFATSFYDYLCRKDVNSICIDIDQVPDYEACDLLDKVCDVSIWQLESDCTFFLIDENSTRR